MRGMEGIIDQLNRSLEGDSWQGASIREILEGVTANEAALHPIPGGHSIWELVYHVTACIDSAPRVPCWTDVAAQTDLAVPGEIIDISVKLSL